MAPITNCSALIKEPLLFGEIQKYLHSNPKPGPVFLELPLDVQAEPINYEIQPFIEWVSNEKNHEQITTLAREIVNSLKICNRPIILLGGGLTRTAAAKFNKELIDTGIPIMTTWNGADRYGADQDNYWGRPNTWGQRAANILIQQSDCLIVIGSRLGLQQTGFAWQEFAPLAKIFQIDIDASELTKGHPSIYRGLACDAASFLEIFMDSFGNYKSETTGWLNFGKQVINQFPLNDVNNVTSPGYIDPYEFVAEL